jgi:hypothetical protein
MLSVETLLILGGTAVTCVVIFASLAAWVWVHWLKLRAREIELSGPSGLATSHSAAPPTSLNRIDLADLKERVRKLEAIASGVDF